MRTGKARLIEQLEALVISVGVPKGTYWKAVQGIIEQGADRIMFDINHDIISKETE